MSLYFGLFNIQFTFLLQFFFFFLCLEGYQFFSLLLELLLSVFAVIQLVSIIGLLILLTLKTLLRSHWRST